MSILGNRVVRTEDPKFLTVGGSYLADLDVAGSLWVVYVLSPFAHARITGVDVEEARRAPGVVDVVVGEDLGLDPTPAPGGKAGMSRPYLATGTVRFVGEPVVAVVAETRTQAVDAAELVFVDYDPLPVVVDPERALEDSLLLFPEAGTNVAMEIGGDFSDSFFDGCEVVVTQRTVNQRVAPCPLEVRGAAARWEPDGRLTYWVSTQAPHGVKATVSRMLGVEPDLVRVIAPDVGGGFGAKIGNYPEELLIPWLARRLGRPVRWTETRSESMLGLGHGRGQVQFLTLGGSRDGIFGAYRLVVVQETGAYPAVGTVLPSLTRMMATGVYRIPKLEFRSRSVVTNTTPTVAYRGAGRPEAAAAIERAVDLFAAEIGMDPAEIRRRNFIDASAFPYTTPSGALYDVGDYQRVLEVALDAAGYDELRAEQAARRERGEPRQLGIGLAVYVEITNGVPGSEYGSVEIGLDGRAKVLAGTSPHGQGHLTAFAMLASEALGIAIDDVDVLTGDTDIVPRGIGTFGSRSLQTGGVAVRQAALEVVEQGRKLAAELLEANPDDVVLDQTEGRFHVIGTPGAGRSWTELAAAAAESGDLSSDVQGRLRAEIDFTAPGPTFPFGAHVAVVEVDTETGKVVLDRLVAVDDAGRILNPLLAEGQVHGGLAQGVAQALLEEFRYDEDGNPQTANFADYAFISATELPSFEIVHNETPTPYNILGAKGIGESGSIGSTPALQNAVADALSFFGVRHVDIPVTPERVWRAIHADGASRAR